MIRTDRSQQWAATRLSAEQIEAVDDTMTAHFPPVRYRETRTGIRIRAVEAPALQAARAHLQARVEEDCPHPTRSVPANSVEREHRVISGFVCVLLFVIALASVAYRVWVAA